MKINQKILSIPPYISTSWKNVVSLHLEKRDGLNVLIIGLVNGSTIEIPNLDQKTLEATFAAHTKYMELTTESSPKGNLFPQGMLQDPQAGMSLPLNLGMDLNMGSILEHNQEAANTPDLPKEMLARVTSFSKVMGPNSIDQFPKPEPHCNCMHCQIMRAVREETPEEVSMQEEEEISEEDLRFREWDIEQKGENLYLVRNPLNQKEEYNVFLGNPVGCTCGKDNCEHIYAVLNS